MKKVLIVIACIMLANTSVFAAQNSKDYFKHGVECYKSGNYTESTNIMGNIVNSDPSNILAHYYLAISYAQTGKFKSAKDEYNNVIILNPNSQIAQYAKQGLKELNTSSNVSSYETNEKTLPEAPKANTYNHSQNSAQYQQTNNTQPSEEEVAKALQTLAKVGLTNGINNTINPEALKMNMLMSSMGGFGGMNNNQMGGMNYNSMNNANMLPYLLMMQNQGNGKNNTTIPQDLINSMMMPDMYSNFGTGN